jgi:nitrogen regulatory protein PII
MKLVIAYLHPRDLSEMKGLLHAQGILRYTVIEGFGHNEDEMQHETYRGVEIEVDLLKKIRLEVVVDDKTAKDFIKNIIKAGKEKRLSGGKISALPIERAYNIKTGDDLA